MHGWQELIDYFRIVTHCNNYRFATVCVFLTQCFSFTALCKAIMYNVGVLLLSSSQHSSGWDDRLRCLSCIQLISYTDNLSYPFQCSQLHFTPKRENKVIQFSSFIAEMLQASKWKPSWRTLKSLGRISKWTSMTWTVRLLCASKHHSRGMICSTSSPQQLGFMHSSEWVIFNAELCFFVCPQSPSLADV